MSLIENISECLGGHAIVALTGAGISTESGIPDYRGPKTRARSRSPLQYQQFLEQESARRRYWARSSIGWPRLHASRPNDAHRALADLEHAGLLKGIITQNVDRLHHRAGSHNVIELHGALEEVRCLDCQEISSRETLQEQLLESNPDWGSQVGDMAPDGDTDLDDPRIASFRVPGCRQCSGVLKPNVVFFGESVPGSVVEQAWRLYEQAEVLLVAGTSLAIYSGFRFVRRASQDRKPIVMLNLSATRADELAQYCWSESLGVALPQIAHSLISTP